MKGYKFIVLTFFINLSLIAQVKTDTIHKEVVKFEIDTTSLDTIKLPDLFVYRDNMSPQEKKDFILLQNRVYKVYPYAKVAADRLVFLNKNLEKLKTTKEKKKYFKLVENYMETEFTDQLKKLSRKQGQILVKLIYRQTGSTTFELIKDYKSGWKAFWSNNTAKVFDINLKSKYLPYEVNEDFLIETILDRAFTRGRLVNQKSANPVDIDELTEFWQKKSTKK